MGVLKFGGCFGTVPKSEILQMMTVLAWSLLRSATPINVDTLINHIESSNYFLKGA